VVRSSSPDEERVDSDPDVATTGTERVIVVFADVGCPFTHVGLCRFVQRRAELRRADVRLHVRAWPLEVVNGAPLDPDFIAEEVDELRRAAATDLFRGFRTDTFPATSVPALALASAAYARGGALGEAVSLELRDLVFEQGVDIADPGVLGAVARPHRLDVGPDDTAAVLADHDEGVRRGVIGSPHFFTPTGSFFCPALDIARDPQGHLRVTANPNGFDAFLDQCFTRA
jgi:2-hydroxychromene-2-carboxylate isomerase